MAMTLAEYLEIDLFLQQVITFRSDRLDQSAFYNTPDVVLLEDYVHIHGFILPSSIVNRPPRILVIEAMAHNPIMRYPSLASAVGYRWHRGKIFTDEERGEVALLEFHRKGA